jgi:L-amino acid N-acyltransferase YncA
MNDIEVRSVRADDAEELAALLNEIIDRGGTTAWEEPFSAHRLADTMLSGRQVICCFVAVETTTGKRLGFQSLLKSQELPSGVVDITTFARVGLTQKGVGSALFAATRAEAARRKLSAINATIRGDNNGGLIFYSRMGFRDHSVKPAVPLKDGTAVDRINKRYLLKS